MPYSSPSDYQRRLVLTGLTTVLLSTALNSLAQSPKQPVLGVRSAPVLTVGDGKFKT